MTLVLTFSLLVLGTLLGAQIFRRPLLVSCLHWAIILIVFFKLSLLLYQTANLYFAWRGSGLSLFLLPPYTSPFYFLFYAYTEFWIGELLAVAIGLLFWVVMRRLNARFQHQFFYDEESLLVFLCFLLIGHPFWIPYLGLILACGLVSAFYANVIKKSPGKISLYYLWTPLAVVSLFIIPVLDTAGFSQLLGF